MNKILEENRERRRFMEKNELSINLEEDLNEIVRLIKGYMDEKYISTLKNKLDGYRSECESNLCKEAQLIQAIIPFMPAEQKILQLIIDAMVYNDMIDKCFMQSKDLSLLYRDENKEKESLKKLVYKLIIFKLITTIEKMELT